MQLVYLKCEDFRCLKRIHFAPSPGLNIIRGANAQGKTSVLEAILYTATSKSHRTSVESELVGHGAEGFHSCIRARGRDREVTLDTRRRSGQKRVKVNGVAQSKMSDLLGKAHVTLFSPEDLSLVKGGASLRRKFLDMELSQINPSYLLALQEYRRSMRQRNE